MVTSLRRVSPMFMLVSDVEKGVQYSDVSQNRCLDTPQLEDIGA